MCLTHRNLNGWHKCLYLNRQSGASVNCDRHRQPLLGNGRRSQASMSRRWRSRYNRRLRQANSQTLPHWNRSHCRIRIRWRILWRFLRYMTPESYMTPEMRRLDGRLPRLRCGRRGFGRHPSRPEPFRQHWPHCLAMSSRRSRADASTPRSWHPEAAGAACCHRPCHRIPSKWCSHCQCLPSASTVRPRRDGACANRRWRIPPHAMISPHAASRRCPSGFR